MANNSTFINPFTFLGSGRALARFVGRPVARFLGVEAAGGIVLMVATAVALIWANIDAHSYEEFWHTEVLIGLGDFIIEEGHFSLKFFVNDALMVLFFFVVGIEIKRELVVGDLRDPRVAMLPAIAAVGGMVVPAGIFFLLNAGSDPVGELQIAASDGWGIPMATDIAFALGIVALLGTRVPPQLKVFLLTLAIVDDIGAIVVIAVFYTASLSVGWLAIAGGTIVATVVMAKVKVWYIPAYVVVGVVMWVAFLESGVHATLAGVIMGLLTPAKPLMSEVQAEELVDTLEGREEISAADVHRMSFFLKEAVPLTERIESVLHPISSFFIIPVFALANAGVLLSSDAISDAAGSRITLGIVLGLVLGKTIGVGFFSLLAVRAGLCPLPPNVTGMHMTGISLMAGVGFTVSIFITGLAYEDVGVQDEAKIGVLFASALAAILGVIILLLAHKKAPPSEVTPDPGEDALGVLPKPDHSMA